MKTIFKPLIRLFAFVALAATTPSVFAQKDQMEIGFIRLINVVAPGEGNTNFLIDGADLLPKGYPLGQKTGGFGVKAGSHSISVKKTGVKTGTTNFTLAKGETLSLVAFAEKVPAEDKDAPPVWEIKILRLKQSDPESGYRLAFLSLCSSDEVKVSTVIEGKDEPQTVYAKRLVVTGVNIGKAKKETEIKVGNESLAWVSMDVAGNYVVIFYEDEKGKVKGLSFFDPKFVMAG
jgi:hypothetical protein